MKQILNAILLLFVISIQLASCQNKENSKNNTMNIKYKWEEGKSAPLGYPIEVYRGGFSTKEGDFVSLYGGITTGTGYWGEPDNGMSSGEKPLPDHLHVQWLSYTEDAMFEVETDIDKEKIAAYFREGYKQRVRTSGEIRHSEFYQIVAGFAPGGVVVVWVAGAGIQKEIGRYQGKKVEIPQTETDTLESPDKNLFSKEYRSRVLLDPGIVPLAVQEENKDKPIPYGLWDTYRERYHWQPVFRIYKGKMGDFRFLYLNGERGRYFHENNLQSNKNSELFYQKQEDGVNAPIPREISFSWKDSKDKLQTGYFKFNEQEILKAFQLVADGDPTTKIEMFIYVNVSGTYASVELRGSNGKKAPIMNHDEAEFF